MGNSFTSMFTVTNPEQAATLGVTLFFILIGLTVLGLLISIIRLAGDAICCLGSVLKCCKDGAVCCANGCKPGEKTDDDEGSAPAAAAAVRPDMGQIMSFGLMVIAILIALIWEFYFAADMDQSRGTANAWSDGCTPSMSTYPDCVKYQAAYRVSFVTFVFFAAMAVVTAAAPQAHNLGWDVKFLSFGALLIGLTFAPNHVFDDRGFVWVARIGAYLFLMLQQVILIDSAYSVNEYLVEKGYASAARPGTEDTWNEYLVACLALSVTTYSAAVTGLVLLLVYFTGCDTSNSFIAFSVLLIAACTVLQLFFTKPENGQGNSFLTTAVVAAYITYLTYVAVSANPVGHCNPLYSSSSNVLALVLGLVVTFASLTATVYFSSKAVTGLAAGGGGGGKPVASADLEAVLTGAAPSPAAASAAGFGLGRASGSGGGGGEGGAWKFNAAMALIACYWCCVLTNWGTPGGGANSASPTAGTATMWMNISASWVCGLLYMWTLVAPLVFPDRDFSR